MIPAGTPEIAIGQLAAAESGGPTIVDVREPGEHVPGAVRISMGQFRNAGFDAHSVAGGTSGRVRSRRGPQPRRRPLRLTTHPSFRDSC